MTNTTHHSLPSSKIERGRRAARVGRIASVARKSLLALGFLCGHTPMGLAADKSEDSTSQLMTEERFAIHGQLTVAIDNGISAQRQRFLNAGGLGILVGDASIFCSSGLTSPTQPSKKRCMTRWPCASSSALI
jgi:hypothetical protein